MGKKLFRVVLGLFLVVWITPKVLASQLTDKAYEDYDFQLEKYRSTYNDFLLKRTQYEKVGTFAVEEQLVISAKAMLIDRIQVWLSFWQIIRTELSESKGMANDRKGELTGIIDDLQAELNTKKDAVEQTTTRTELLAEAVEINEKNGAYTEVYYEMLTSLKLSNLEWAIGQLKTYTEELKGNINIQVRDSAQKEERLRGVNEAMTNFALVTEKLDKVKVNLISKRESSWQSRYKTIIEIYGETYELLTKSYKLDVELSKGIEL